VQDHLRDIEDDLKVVHDGVGNVHGWSEKRPGRSKSTVYERSKTV